MTMTLVSTVTVGTATSTVEFASVPQTGTDLYLLISFRGNAGDAGFAGMELTLNNSSSGNSRYLQGSGSAALSSTEGLAYLGNIPRSNTTANTFGNVGVYITNYTSTSDKSFSVDNVTENNATAATQQIWAGVKTSTTAVTNLKIVGSGCFFAVGSTASLYTVTKGSGGASVA